MKKTSKTLLVGFLSFAIIFATTAPMQAEGITVLEPDCDVMLIFREFMKENSPNTHLMSSYDFGDYNISELNILQISPLETIELVGALGVTHTSIALMSLAPGFRPPSTLNYQGFMNGGWHVGVLSYVSSTNFPCDITIGNTFWIVTYRGILHMAGR